MPSVSDVLRGSLPAIMVGVGAVVVAPIVLPAVAAVAKPLFKGAIKGYLMLADSMKEVAAEAGEQWSDLVAEARAERAATTVVVGKAAGKVRAAKA